LPWWKRKPWLIARLLVLIAIALYSAFVVISVPLRVTFDWERGDYDPAVLWAAVALMAICGALASRGAVRTLHRLRWDSRWRRSRPD
jgi:uncharacterized membrane protein